MSSSSDSSMYLKYKRAYQKSRKQLSQASS